MSRVIVVLGSLFILALLLPREGVEQLTEQLRATPVSGQPATTLILNKNLAGASADKTVNPTTVQNLAQTLGFVDENGGMTETVLPSPGLDVNEFKKKVATWKAEDRVKAARVIEEPNPISVLEKLLAEARTAHQSDQQGFVAFLKQMKVQPEWAKLSSLDAAKLPAEKEKGPLYYFAERFYLEKALDSLKERSAEAEKLKAKLLYGGPYAGSIDATRNWDAIMLHAWRTRAFTAPWVADLSWQNGEFSPQVVGYYLALARAAQTAEPIFCDLHVGDGNNPPSIRRSFYQAIAQGAKAIRFMGATPFNLGAGAERLALGHVDSWKTIRELTHEAGQFEQFLLRAKPRESQIGIVVSLTSELWDPSLWVHEERKAIYHAARLGGHNIAILTEDDIVEGNARRFATIYVVGTHLRRDAAQVLTRWMKADRSLGLVGGPLWDEYDQPLTELHQLMGITDASWESKQQPGAAKITLAQLNSFDTIFWNYENLKRQIPAVYGKLKVTLDPQEKETMDIYGKFADGSPAIFRRVLPGTKAHLWTFCAPVGSGWFKTVLPPKRWEQRQPPNSYNHELLIRKMDGEIGDIVMAASGESRWDVITDNLGIESILMESPRGMALVCINWSDRPQKAWLTVQFIPGKYTRAKSLAQGQLDTKRTGATLSFHVKVDVTDFITIEP